MPRQFWTTSNHWMPGWINRSKASLSVGKSGENRTMNRKTPLVLAMLLWTLAAGPVRGQQGPDQQEGEKLPREVKITEIPDVVAADAKWQQVWQGTDNADGIVGTPDGGLLFAQEQPSTVRKLDRSDNVSVYVKDTHGAGALAIDSHGRILA